MENENVIGILHLEDNKTDSQLVELLLRKANINFKYFLTDNETDYIDTLKKQHIDVILSDYNLPGYSGTEALLLAKNEYPLIPFVFVSGAMGEDIAIKSLLSGATDYILKNKMNRLGSAVLRAYKDLQVQKARINAEQALVRSEENYHRSVSESPLGIRIVTVDGKTIYVNKSYLEIYEFASLDEFNNTSVKKRYTQKSYEEHLVRKDKIKDGKEVLNYEVSIVCANAEIRYVKALRTEVLWYGIRHFQVIIQDITAQKKLTADLIAAKEKAEENERLKTAFLNNISHEVRTPMNAIVGFSELLGDEDITAEKQTKYVKIIIQSSNQLLSIITQIVDIATIQSGQEKISKRTFSLNSTIKVLYEQFRAKAESNMINFSYKNSLIDGEDIIVTDEIKLIQILSNLISNALKFTKRGSIEFGYVIKEKHLEFFIKDTGIGIPNEMHEEIFKRFRQVENTNTREYGGSGLGLSISKAYIELLGGKIWLISSPGEGSEFYFIIPYEKKRI